MGEYPVSIPYRYSIRLLLISGSLNVATGKGFQFLIGILFDSYQDGCKAAYMLVF